MDIQALQDWVTKAANAQKCVNDLLESFKAELAEPEKPMKEFTIDNDPYHTITVKMAGGMLRLRDADGYILIRRSELPAFILNLSRLVATAAKDSK